MFRRGGFGRPGASRGERAFPQIRFVSLVESGTHVLFGSRMADYATSEIAMAKEVLPNGVGPNGRCNGWKLNCVNLVHF